MVVALNFIRVVVSSEHILKAKDPLPRKIHTCAFILKILHTTWVYGLRSKKFFCHFFSLVILSSCFPAFPIMLMIPQTVSSTQSSKAGLPHCLTPGSTIHCKWQSLDGAQHTGWPYAAYLQLHLSASQVLLTQNIRC